MPGFHCIYAGIAYKAIEEQREKRSLTKTEEMIKKTKKEEENNPKKKDKGSPN